MTARCEVCQQPCSPRPLRDGSVLDQCQACGHVIRDLVRSPAHHRSAAYGGDPGLDRVRLTITTRTLESVRPDDPRARVFEMGFGAGALLRTFADRGNAIVGCDPDQLGVAIDPEV